MFEATYFTIGVVASAYVLVKTLPLWLAALIFGVIFVHEFGHYTSAYRHGRVVRLPVFIPLYWGIQGATRVKDVDPVTDEKIALAGPKAGLAVTILAAIGFAFVGFTPGLWACLWLFVFQLYSGTLGHDGRKYWRAHSVLRAAEQGSPEFAVAVP
jgi:hypothetical protein